MTELLHYCRSLADQAKVAARSLATAKGGVKDAWLYRSAELIEERGDELIAANSRDVEQAPSYGLSTAAIDRLRLTEARLAAMADALQDIASLPNPVGEIFDSNVRPNGLLVTRVRVPLGVVFFVYESRPNVTVDAAAICVKSGNAVILRGGKEALHSNLALHRLMSEALQDVGLPPHAVQLVETTDREAVGSLLGMSDRIDVAIPRGGKSLIERVVQEARMPVIKHFDGICHVYVDQSANLDMAEQLVINSKCQRPGVCNAAECLLVHAACAAEFLPRIGRALQAAGVEIRGDARTRELLPFARPATETDYRSEYLDLILSVRVVPDMHTAMQHIDEYGSHHTETIVTTDLRTANLFTATVDSAAVIVNASTRFNDGGEFGLGAEIGISTDRFHARGPCGLKELTTYKYVVHGDGQIK